MDSLEESVKQQIPIYILDGQQLHSYNTRISKGYNAKSFNFFQDIFDNQQVIKNTGDNSSSSKNQKKSQSNNSQRQKKQNPSRGSTGSSKQKERILIELTQKLQNQNINKKLPQNQSGSNNSQELKSDTSSYKPSQSKCSRISQTKHIPKNFGRAIISFILEKVDKVKIIHKEKQKNRFNKAKFQQFLKKKKRNINTIQNLRALWTSKDNIYANQIRVLSYEFLRKHSIYYIFHSRIVNYGIHLKYRKLLMKNLKNPNNFTLLKEY